MTSHERLEREIRRATLRFLAEAIGADPSQPIPFAVRGAYYRLLNSTREAALEYANPGHAGLIEAMANRLIGIATGWRRQAKSRA